MNKLESLAEFIASPEGALYGAYCRTYGKEPGAIFADEVLAFQVDAAYMLREQLTQPREDDA